ncbi:UvrD-helicase domain-containing protein [Deinococcus radiomollis]|uniref:UvrD-helicase domain-containing protein n=1 Tax=Deinococcus radiomollis TaxID=468916 RepID=UPI00389170C2
MGLTAQQERAVRAAGSVAVVAGAGSGKTHMLVSRYLHHLESGLSPLEVVAVTFTEKAAAELRARIRREVAQQRPDDFETLAELEAAPISTLHALCARILREHPGPSSVRPDVAVMDAGQAALWQAQHFAAALGTLPAPLFRRLSYSRMAVALEALVRDPLLAEQALAVGNDRWTGWTETARAGALLDLTGQPAWRAAIDFLRATPGPAGDRIELARVAALTAAGALQEGQAPGPACNDLLAVKLVGGSVKAWSPGAFVEVKAAISILRVLVETEVKKGLLTFEPGPADDDLAAALPDLRTAFALIREELARRKALSGVVDFSDLEVHALRALRDEGVRGHYHARWKAFLIDEAQDTNPVQLELLDRLSAGAARTVVGDEKQSIYRFRRADVTLFRQMRGEIIDQGGEEVSLDLSFRSHQGLVARSNAVFGPLLGDLHAPLQADRVTSAWNVPVEAWTMAPDEEGKKRSKAQQQAAEAGSVARRVRALMDEGRVVFDPALGAERPLRPADIAVLTRGWAALPRFGLALAQEGVPARDTGSGSLLGTREALDGQALLSALALQEPVSLVAALRSPFCAVSDPCLLRLARERGEQSWMAALLSSTDPELGSARQLFAELLREARSSPPSRLLALADRRTGYTAVLTNLWDSERRLADWRGMTELVRELERGDDEVFTVVRRLKELVQGEVPVPRPVLEAGDAVTLTTMHSSKGLEWPLVVVADLNWSPPPGTNTVLIDAEYGVALRGDEEGGQSLVYTLIAERHAAQDAREARRLLYVAATRARDGLLLSGSGPAGKGSLLELLLPGLQAAGVDVQELAPLERDFELTPLPALPLPPEPAAIWADPLPRETSAETGFTPFSVGQATPVSSGWEEIRELLDSAWWPWTDAIEAAGLPAPDDVHLDLPVNGRVSGDSALMFWSGNRKGLALMDADSAGTPGIDAVLVRRGDDPEVAVQALRDQLPSEGVRR